ncbi:hypothetical protein Droror1_Dr00008737 [Drosera rotundifolia]
MNLITNFSFVNGLSTSAAGSKALVSVLCHLGVIISIYCCRVRLLKHRSGGVTPHISGSSQTAPTIEDLAALGCPVPSSFEVRKQTYHIILSVPHLISILFILGKNTTGTAAM